MDIEFSCPDENITKYFPPVPAKKVLPEWYKSIHQYILGRPITAKEMLEMNELNRGFTIKACMPFLDYMSSGYVIRHPADVAITSLPVEKKHRDWFWSTKYAEGFVGCGSHSNEQLPLEIDGVKNTYIKILQPWTVKTPPGYSCFFYQPLDFESPVQLFSGIVDTDTFDSPVNFPGIVKKEGEFILKAGDPLMVVFPFKRDDWKMSVKAPTNLSKWTATKLFMERGYKKLFHKPKRYE